MIFALVTFALPILAATYSETIDNTNPTKTGRLWREELNPSVCGSPKAFPGLLDQFDQFHYDVYTIKNTKTFAVCVTVTLDGVNSNVMASAYLGNLNPADISENYLADTGASTGIPNNQVSLGFTLQPGATAQIVVNESGVTPTHGPQSYTLTILPDLKFPWPLFIPKLGPHNN